MPQPRFIALCAPLLALALDGCSTESSSAVAAAGDAGAEAALPEATPEASAEVGPCVPLSCMQASASCGEAPDGCGGVLSCGQCEPGLTCGAAGPNKCAVGSCTPKTCAQVAASCGLVSDNCASVLDCGGCPVPQACGGGGTAHQCGCTPRSCAQAGVNCGRAPDGCGGSIECGTCLEGQTCGAAGPNLCGGGSCTAKSCAQVGASCGVASDGCADVLSCGGCQAPNVCGGGGVLNQCGCVLRTCAQQGTSCGTTPDGCFGSLDCGGCSSGLVCTAGSCEPLICEQGWGDCDGDSSNGCEQDLSNSAQHCGACSQPCVCGDGACDVSEDSSTCPGDCAAVGSTLLVQQTINEQNYAVQCFNKGAWRLVWQATGAANNITTFVYKWPEQEPVLEHCGTPGNNGVYPLRIFNGSGLPSNGTLILQCFAPGQAHFYNVDAISLENAPMASYLSTEPSTACP